MKRNLLLVFVCLVLTMPSVLAQCSCQRLNTTAESSKSVNYPREATKYKKYIKHIQQDRATVYNALNLSDEQIQKREDLMNENNPIYEQKFDCLMKESFKLQAIENAGATDKEINAQKKVISSIKKSIERTLSKENKAFRKCLNGQQKAKYSMIKKLERQDYKKDLKQKDYYKSNPQMRPFGNPRPCPAPIGR
jgi:hypothetical protein